MYLVILPKIKLQEITAFQITRAFSPVGIFRLSRKKLVCRETDDLMIFGRYHCRTFTVNMNLQTQETVTVEKFAAWQESRGMMLN